MQLQTLSFAVRAAESQRESSSSTAVPMSVCAARGCGQQQHAFKAQMLKTEGTEDGIARGRKKH